MARELLTDHREGVLPQAFSLFEQKHVPHPERLYTMEHPVWLGTIPIVRVQMGTHVPTSFLFDELAKEGVFDEDPYIRSRLESLGFPGSRRFPSTVDIRSDEFQERGAVEPIADIAHSLAYARGWREVDEIIIGSSTIIEDVPEMVRSYLEETGIGVGSVFHVYNACNSKTEGIVHACQSEGKKIVVGFDPLTGSLTNYDDLPTYATFGAGAAGMAFESGQDGDIQHLGGTTLVDHDTYPVLTIQEFRSHPPAHDRIPHERHGSRFRLVGETNDENFAVTEYGIFKSIPAGKKHLWMDSKATYDYFVQGDENGSTADLVSETVTEYEESSLPREFGHIQGVYGHQPSREVVTGLNGTILGKLASYYNLNNKEASALKRLRKADFADAYDQLLSLNIPPVILDWVMDSTGHNNASAATSGIALHALTSSGAFAGQAAHFNNHLKETGRESEIRKGVTMLQLGLGVGNVRAAHVLHFPKVSAHSTHTG